MVNDGAHRLKVARGHRTGERAMEFLPGSIASALIGGRMNGLRARFE